MAAAVSAREVAPVGVRRKGKPVQHWRTPLADKFRLEDEGLKWRHLLVDEADDAPAGIPQAAWERHKRLQAQLHDSSFPPPDKALDAR
eukprot:SAG11_NODE_36476_length_261_cov_0.938272_1_plen_87_part_11